MEFLYISILTAFVISLPLSLLFLFKKNIKSIPSGKLPPGKTGWPIIGETMEFVSTGWNGHPEKFILDRMSKYSSLVFRTSLMLEDVAVFCGAAGNKFLFSNENKLVTAWWPSSIGKIFPAGSKYKEEGMKSAKMIHDIFKPNALQTYVGMMDYITERHFSLLWDDKKEVVVVPLAKQFTFALACKIFISIEDLVEVARLLKPFECIANGILSIPIDLPGTPLRRAINASNLIMKELSVIIKQRKIDLAEGKASPSQDILSHMISTSDENGMFMEDEDIADKILALLVGGYDTASSVCALIVKYLAELPKVYDGVYKEQMEIAKSKAPGELLNWDDLAKMKYSWNVGCEVLRLAPPLQGTFREATTNFMYNGFSIPKGWKCYWNAYSTHKNPEYFKEPQKFDPSRFEGSGPVPYAFVPFGGGPRMCPGREYARLEVLVFMHHLVKRFKWEKVIPDEKIVVNPLPSLAKGLPIRLYPQSH